MLSSIERVRTETLTAVPHNDPSLSGVSTLVIASFRNDFVTTTTLCSDGYAP
jgi:hypothetical protein